MSLKARPSAFQRIRTSISRATSAIVAALKSNWHVSVECLRQHCSLPWFVAQLIVLVIICILYWKWPAMPVGIAIGLAGLVAAIMTVRNRWKLETFLWIVIIAALWAMDSHNIYREQKTHDAEQKAISDSLTQTQCKIDEAQRKLEVTKQEVSDAITQLGAISQSQGKTLKLTTENLKQLTGGDSFCYIDFTDFVDGPRLINGGGYPLHAITINALDLDEDKRLFDRIPEAQNHPEWDRKKDFLTRAEAMIPMGDLGPYGWVPVPSIPILQGEYERTLDIIYTGGVGYVVQHTCLKHATNSVGPPYSLAQATKVMTQGKLRKLVIDQNYPREANGDVACFSTKAKK